MQNVGPISFKTACHIFLTKNLKKKVMQMEFWLFGDAFFATSIKMFEMIFLCK